MIEIKHRYTGAVIFTYNGANLCGADLRDAYLCNADLCGANLCGANLCGADLRDANLCNADLCGANLCDANLRDANLYGAYLRGADLCGANLCGANLCGADLRDADLRGANLRDAKGLGAFVIAPTGGAFVGWKKCREGVIVKLAIPADAARVNCIGSRKCRAEFVDVLEVIGADIGIGLHDSNTRYAVGQRVIPDSYDPSDRVECSHGIHFFIARAEAEEFGV